MSFLRQIAIIKLSTWLSEPPNANNNVTTIENENQTNVVTFC